MLRPMGQQPHPFGLQAAPPQGAHQVRQPLRPVAQGEPPPVSQPVSYTHLDEPFAGVDPQRADRILSALGELAAPVILVSHEPAVLDRADRVIRLDGPPLTLLSAP